MRTLKGKGIEAIPDKLGFRIWYKDGKKMTKKQKEQLTWEQICKVVSPQNEQEWKEYYQEQQADWDYEEMKLKEYIENYEEPEYEPDLDFNEEE